MRAFPLLDPNYSHELDSSLSFSLLTGLVLVGAWADTAHVFFELEDGRIFELYHAQDCCESVLVEDIVGNLEDLIGVPILEADESCSEPEGEPGDDCRRWTFYRLSTIKGDVSIRWLGRSNGYYSEKVDARWRRKVANLDGFDELLDSMLDN